MEAVPEALKSLRAWQIATAVAVLVAAGGATYGMYALVSGSDKTDLDENQQLIPVKYGNLVNQVSVNGSLIFPERKVLTFGTQGTVDAVLVEEGQEVVEGQLLARLDAETIATLEKSVAQARVNLQDARDALDELLQPSLLDVAGAEASVAEAGLAVRNAKDALAGLLEPSIQTIAKSEAAVADAKVKLSDARDALASLLEPSAEQMAQARTAVVNAKLAVKEARKALEEDVGEAQFQVDSATTALANARRDLKIVEREWDDKLQGPQDAAEQALESYKAVFDKWLGIDLSVDQVDLDPDSLLSSWGVDLSSLFSVRYGRFENVHDDPATPWDELVVGAWQYFYLGSVLADCEGVTDTSQTLCVRQELDDAWEVRQDAKNDLDMVQTQAAKAVASAEDAVARAEDSNADAEETLNDLTAGPDSLEMESRREQLELTLAKLQVAEENLSILMNGVDQEEVEASRKQVALAEASLAEAEADLDELVNGVDPMELEVKQKQVALAEASLATAQGDLSEMVNGVGSLEVALREADVAAVEASLAGAIQRLDDATLEAPWDGIVSLVNVEDGDPVNPNAPIVEVVNPAVVEVDGIVDEIDVLFVQRGARADVTMDALPGQVLEGTVSELAAGARTQQGVVSFPIRVRVAVPQGVQLREGLSAIASVVTREDRDVLLVPLQALYGSFEEPVVRVMFNGRIEERPVVLGNSDDFWVVVERGLTEGEQIVMEAQEASTGGFRFGGFRGGFGGGFGGGPRPPGSFPGGGQRPPRN